MKSFLSFHFLFLHNYIVLLLLLILHIIVAPHLFIENTQKSHSHVLILTINCPPF